MSQVLEFVSLSPSGNLPVPAVKTLPEWYKKAKKYDHESSTYKNCAPFFESMSSGYVFLTPTDIEFYEVDGIPRVRVDSKYAAFVTERSPMNEFQVPLGYSGHHFSWLPEYGIRTPVGYSVLYTTPLNGFSLPFLNTAGSINNDKVFQPGSVPFFLQKGFVGTIPAGTPYLQAIPFKREDWVSKETQITSEDIEHFKPNSEHIKNYYREHLWESNLYG